MWSDPVVSEVRKIREEHAINFNFNLDEIYQDLKNKEKNSGRTYANYTSDNIKKTNSNSLTYKD
jgi:hypothetical protein